MAERGEDLLTAVERWTANGGQVAAITLTMRHNASQRLSDLWDACSAAWTAARGGSRSARDAAARAGMAGWVRRTDHTHGVNGWHVHVHALLFLDSGDHAPELGDAMFDAWASRLQAHGLSAVRDSGGLVCKVLDLTEATAAATEYLVKGTYSGPPEAAARRKVARELAHAGTKRAKGSSRTPFEILADCVEGGEARDFALWREWEDASSDRRAITWSQGIREQLRLMAERSDDEIAASGDDQAVNIAAIPVATWDALQAVPGGPCRLLEVAESVPIARARAAIAFYLNGLGLPPPRPPTVVPNDA